MNKPAYDFKEFETVCAKNKSKVIVLSGAANTAKTDFGLGTKADIIGFIGNKGLERPKFINSKLWGNNPEPMIEIRVDAYEFYSGLTFGYLAFFYSPITLNWLIKSFKKHMQDPARNLPFIGLNNKLH